MLLQYWLYTSFISALFCPYRDSDIRSKNKLASVDHFYYKKCWLCVLLCWKSVYFLLISGLISHSKNSPFCIIAHAAVFSCKIILLELRTGTSSWIPWFSAVLLRLTINTARINQQYWSCWWSWCLLRCYAFSSATKGSLSTVRTVCMFEWTASAAQWQQSITNREWSTMVLNVGARLSLRDLRFLFGFISFSEEVM